MDRVNSTAVTAFFGSIALLGLLQAKLNSIRNARKIEEAPTIKSKPNLVKYDVIICGAGPAGECHPTFSTITNCMSFSMFFLWLKMQDQQLHSSWRSKD